MKKLISRLLYGIAFAIPMMIVTFALASAAAPAQETIPNQPLDCGKCHVEFQEAWENGAHGNATRDPDFLNAWREQGEPVECLSCHVTGYDPETGTWEEEGITCRACHSPITENHPEEPMASNRSAQLCGECHNETYFEWQVSAHREEGLDCYGCHDPHATGLKSQSAAMLCATCHRDRSSNYTHSAHSEQGLTCANCHLVSLSDDPSEGHAGKDHSFFVSLTTCNACHAYQMHDPVDVHLEVPTPMPPDAMAAVETVVVTEEPAPVSPVGFSTLSGLIGIALGVIIAPWIERLNRSNRLYDEEEK